MDWSRSYPVAALGLSVSEVETVLELYVTHPRLIELADMERIGDVLSLIGETSRARLHLWCLGVLDRALALPGGAADANA